MAESLNPILFSHVFNFPCAIFWLGSSRYYVDDLAGLHRLFGLFEVKAPFSALLFDYGLVHGFQFPQEERSAVFIDEDL